MFIMVEKVFDYSIGQGFLWSEVNLKGERKYYVEGYASTIDEDKAGEIVNLEAQEDLLAQIKSENITLDVEHAEWYDENGAVLNKPKNTMIPVAKVVSAELRERGVWIKAEINRNIPSFRSVWNSIKEGFLKAFSVAFYPVTKAGKEISKINLVNITLTGSPVNPNATFNAVMKSVKAHIDQEKNKNVEADKMSEEVENKKVEEPVVEEKPEPVVEEKKEEEVVVVEPKVEEKEEEVVKEPEVKAQRNEEIEALKAEIKALREEQTKMKAELEKPVMKAVKEDVPEVPKKEQAYVSPLNLI